MIDHRSLRSESFYESSHQAVELVTMDNNASQPPQPEQQPQNIRYLDIPPLFPITQSSISSSSSYSSATSYIDNDVLPGMNQLVPPPQPFYQPQRRAFQMAARINIERNHSQSEFAPYYVEPEYVSRFPSDSEDLYYRERSKSMGSCSLDQQQAYYSGFVSGMNAGLASRGELIKRADLVRINEKNDSFNFKSEASLEDTRRRLTLLFNEKNQDMEREDGRLRSQPGSPQFFGGPIIFSRKYSEGNRSPYAKFARLNWNKKQDEMPVDLSFKRPRSYTNEIQHRLPQLRRALLGEHDESEESGSHSILKSVLNGRGRSNSMSVSSLLQSGGASSRTMATVPSVKLSSKNQPVTLAKKNLLPITAHVISWIEKMTQQAFSIQIFANFNISLQEMLLRNGFARILLLDMAETNFNFAVTIVQVGGEDAGVGEVPNMHFVESVQNFILKCQSLSIQSDEYACLKIMTLFRYNSNENAVLIEKVNLQARSTLNDLVRASKPHDKLRYPSLLLLLHSLHSISAAMIEALFCVHLSPPLESYLRDLITAQAAKHSAVDLAC